MIVGEHRTVGHHEHLIKLMSSNNQYGPGLLPGPISMSHALYVPAAPEVVPFLCVLAQCSSVAIEY